MPSLFPGMNPYIEQDDVWHDFHERFLPAAAEAIGIQVQPDDIVKIDEHVYVHESESFIEIRDRRSRELVCVIELLSPANRSPGSRPRAVPGEAREDPRTVRRTWWRSTCCASAIPCRRRIDPLAPTRSRSVGSTIVPWPISGRSDCGTRCP